MVSESITTQYGDKFTVAIQDASRHILLRADVKGDAEAFMYGLPVRDFRSFVKACLRLVEQLGEQVADDA